ncbi:hypothetical protein [Cronobacter phage JC01]|uniref:Phosphoadenosine phosphosulphate reductase domain-containing protein n=1 Tax=Cronobacter phage JC01 TaxID=2729575 RepID=A0A6M3YNR2_9CAUD|nr:phosphoadenosine phosphosulfate reductase [Cronobacter phage JC01]QJI52285.1 hypothetical protein [Cronobacter phage JC01]
MKPRLVAAMSGGRTSAHMTYRLLQEKSDEYDIKVLFANTGFEHPATLDFVHNCDVQLGFNTVWVEAITHEQKGVRTGWKVVTYETASRKGEPYIEMCRKYGLPNTNYLHCTRELKEIPIHGYLWEALGWAKGEYLTAVGMRIDEPRRIKPKKPDRQTRQNKVYPLAHWWPTTKEDVLDWWEFMPFDLGIPEHCGNCVFCFKKSDAKLLRAFQDNPEYFHAAAEMEKSCGDVGPNVVEGPRKMYRGFRSAADLIATFSEVDNDYRPLYEDAPGNCTEECNPFGEDW